MVNEVAGKRLNSFLPMRHVVMQTLRQKQIALFLLLPVWLICVFASDTVSQSQQAAVSLALPNGLALDQQDNLYISDIGAHCIFKLDRQKHLILVAGTGSAGFSGDGGPASKAQLHAPHDLIFDSEGNLLIADTGNNRIRRIDQRGIIITIAGDGRFLQSSYNGTVPPTSLNNPQSLARERAGTLLIADTYNHVVRRLERNGTLSVFAGSVAGFAGDGGPATAAQMSLPMAVAVAPDDSVYISDAGNSRIRRVTPDGLIQTIAGFGPAQDTYGGGFKGDGGPASKAQLFSATDLKCDTAGNLYIVDSGNHRIRIIRNQIINTIAGTGAQGYSGNDSSALQAGLNTPQKIVLARDGTFWVSERAGHAIRKVNAQGNISTVVRGSAAPE